MILETIIILVYSVALLLIFLYALAQLNLLFNYLKARKKHQKISVCKGLCRFFIQDRYV